jgi:hypothetical protein
MSTFAYARITKRREELPRPTAEDGKKGGVGRWVDSTAALVPAEVLAINAVLLDTVTETRRGADGALALAVTNVDDAKTLFVAMLALAAVIYLLGHVGRFDKWDPLRTLIPLGAFFCWTALANPAVFAAVLDWSDFTRMLVALVGAAVLAVVATLLSYRADDAEPSVANGVMLRGATGKA